jgi:TPP-dependent pyruvate/acetoin dehydrogenase alpha subunit
MHVLDPSAGVLGAAPIVSGTIPLAVGAALAAVVRGERRVSVCFFGDGATGEGALYESMNLAALRKLPVLFVCENNLYSTHLPIRECRAGEEVFRIAEPFGIPSEQIDGNDVLGVYAAARDAVDRARSGAGPSFLECLTYRLRGHVGPDDNIQGSRTDIRPQSEVEAWRQRDPLPRIECFLREHGLASAADIEALREGVRQEVEGAFAYARASAFPTPEPSGEVARG